MDKCCKICKLSDENGESAVLFPAPQEAKRRKTWNDTVDVFLSQDCFVCEKHLNSMYFPENKNVIKHNSNALPINGNENSETALNKQSKENSDQHTFQQDVKALHPELVLVGPITSEQSTSRDLDTFLDVDIKVELQDIPEPFVFINEEQFDSGRRLTPSKSKDNSNIDIDKRFSKTVLSTCGRIDFEVSENVTNYKLTCNYCDTKILIENWKEFVEHVEKNHLAKANKFDNNDEREEEEEDCLEKANNDTEDSNFNENNISFDESDNYEPKSKIIKKEQKIISFGRTSKDKVLELLRLVKSHAILWYRRQSVKERFDEALKEVTTEFNAKFSDYQMSEEEIRLSITRIKYLYQRLTDTKHRRHISDASFKSKFSEYFELCDDIEVKSKTVKAKCQFCGVSFLGDIDLQIHVYRIHNIGELPFKCDRCGQGYSKASALANHRKNHTDKVYNCEYCSRKFDQQSKLHAHLRMHTGSKQICEICGKQFENAYRYKRHKLHHEPPKIKCEICGKMLYEKYTLSEHMKSHQNERQYSCEICHKTFNRQNGLAIHKRSVHKIATQYVWAK